MTPIPGYDRWKLMTPEEAYPDLADPGEICPACDGEGCSECGGVGVMDAHDAKLLAEHLENEAIELAQLVEWTLAKYGELPECEVRGLDLED